jgi:hypothetical protein
MSPIASHVIRNTVVSVTEHTDTDPAQPTSAWLAVAAGGSGQLAADHPHEVLLAGMQDQLDSLEAVLVTVNDTWVSEDLIYRFWHQSFKVYQLQETTERIVAALRAVAPSGSELHPWFLEIVRAGTGQRFELAHNQDWTRHTRPIVEAFFHARFMLEMVVRYGRELEAAPMLLPSGWAAVLELYGIR